MPDLPADAITAAHRAVEKAMHGRPTQRLHLVLDEVIATALEAAAPALRAQERKRLEDVRQGFIEIGRRDGAAAEREACAKTIEYEAGNRGGCPICWSMADVIRERTDDE